ncbi:DUF11 domain-containing protein [Pseudovibrio denitrificans]|uniref:DUF11 domain-containing protein n=1 Tax=Pseudovibrio denitrificans TaxID=258256 RepID=UPI0006D22DC9|nr:DUF11 domain-containing protein [Pseudovibrio denitrificans]
MTFALQLTPGANSGGVYNLEASFAGNQLTDGNDGGFAADNVVDFPSGSEVEFRDNNGNTITNTGVLAADEAYEFTAHVTLPTNTSPDDYDIRFRAYSPVTGVDDQKLDRISVERFVDIGISPPTNENTILAGGVTEYKHTLTNNGNIDLMAGDVEVSDSPNNFQAVLYYDANANGEIDTGEPVISNLSQLSSSGLASGLASGEQANLILRVTAPATANTGVTDTITIIVGNALQVTGGIDADDAIELNNVSSDLTTIVGKVLELLKEQAADNECNGPADGAFGIGQLEISPGQCINYRVTATNNGDQPVEQVVIIDKTPDFTKLESSEAGTEINATNAGVAIGSENLEAIDDGGAGALQAEIGTLAPGQDGVLNYTVRVDE